MPQRTQRETLELLFADYILPWCGTMLGKVEGPCAHAVPWHHGAVDPDAIAGDVGTSFRKKMSNNM